MPKWSKATLADACADTGLIQTGPFGSQLHKADYRASGVPVIMPTNIRDGRVIEEGIAYIDKEDAQRLHRHRVLVGDIVFSRRGEIDKCAVITPREAGWLCGTGCLLSRPNVQKANPYFLGYSISTHESKTWLRQHAVGATMPNLNTGILERLPIPWPSKAVQDQIAETLKAFDDKIELNRQMNETLEASARALFRDWFVDFGPTKAKMAGAMRYLAPDLWALFPDRLDDDCAPAGWRSASLADLVICQNRKAKPEEIEQETSYIGLEHMPRRSIALDHWESASKVTSAKSIFRRREILFGKLRPYFHKVGMAAVNGICSTDIVVMAPKQDRFEAIALACVSTDIFVAYTSQASTGTKMPRTSWKTMKDFPLTIPSDEISDAFQALCGPMLDRILSNIEENRTLAETRDLLLPKLMSGEIRIREAEQTVSAVV